MPSEADRWKAGDLRNTIGHTHGATGAVTGGVEGHVKSEPRTDPEGKHYGGDAEGVEPLLEGHAEHKAKKIK
ncbi:MAG TPA: hypothetical protein VD973_04735 [Symbiobacteriaceae bacterium]|jgi:hypothetical protein|nr:hypothetical protein [Symbiobacteriaceae bacterium]HYF76411.1 hypothetical protein [Symbiobacteriaceae bacterium]